MFEIAFFVLSISILTTGILNHIKQHMKIKTSEKHIGDYKIEYFKK